MTTTIPFGASFSEVSHFTPSALLGAVFVDSVGGDQYMVIMPAEGKYSALRLKNGVALMAPSAMIHTIFGSSADRVQFNGRNPEADMTASMIESLKAERDKVDEEWNKENEAKQLLENTIVAKIEKQNELTRRKNELTAEIDELETKPKK